MHTFLFLRLSANLLATVSLYSVAVNADDKTIMLTLLALSVIVNSVVSVLEAYNLSQP